MEVQVGEFNTCSFPVISFKLLKCYTRMENVKIHFILVLCWIGVMEKY